MRCILAVFLLCATAVFAQESLTNDDIVKLMNLKMSQDDILHIVRAAQGSYTLDTPAIVKLAKTGVSEPVIIAMGLANQIGAAPQMAIRKPVCTGTLWPATLSEATDGYFKPKSGTGTNCPSWVPLRAETVRWSRAAGMRKRMAKTLTATMKGRYDTGTLKARFSPTEVPSNVDLAFSSDKFAVVRLAQGKRTRSINDADKQRQDCHSVPDPSSTIFRYTCGDLERGEYGAFIDTASSAPATDKNGKTAHPLNLGTMYTFHVGE
jgi:hypothetical protein